MLELAWCASRLFVCVFVLRRSFKTLAFTNSSELEGNENVSKGEVFEVLSPHLLSTIMMKDSISYKCL